MKTIEDVLTEIEKNNKEIGEILDKNKKLAQDLRNRPDEDWDWVSVSTASRFWNISVAKMYQRINRGSLKCRRFDGKVYVSLKEVKEIAD